MDREKVIKELTCCIYSEEECECPEDCPYVDDDMSECQAKVMRDALLLLKEQEAVKPKSKVRHGASPQIQHFCGNCNTMLHGKPKYCSECGRSVKWK